MADQSTPVQIGSGLQEALPVFIVGGGGGGGGGVTVIAGTDGTAAASEANPVPVSMAQMAIDHGPLALTAATATTIIPANPGVHGVRILNYISEPVYLTQGTTGTPPSGAGSDYVPAAQTIGGKLVPGQWEPPYSPVSGLRGVCAAAGSITVTVW